MTVQAGFICTEELKTLRSTCVNMVMGTNMKKHFDIMSRFQARLLDLLIHAFQQSASWGRTSPGFILISKCGMGCMLIFWQKEPALLADRNLWNIKLCSY